MHHMSDFILKRKILLFSIAIFLLNLLIKLLFIDSNDIARDEPFSIFHAQMPILDIIYSLKGGNNPPLYEILLHFWIKLFGIEAFAVRLPSLIFSCFTALVIFRIGLSSFNFTTALTASLVYTFSTLHTSFAHEARSYPLFIFLVVLSFFYAIRFFQHKETRHLIFLIITDILIIYTHYFGFFVLLCLFCGVFIFKLNKHQYKQIIIAAVLILVSFIPILSSFVMQFFYSVNRGTWISPPQWNHLYGFINVFLNNKYVTLTYLGCMLCILIIHFIQKTTDQKIIKKDTFKNTFYVFIFFMFPYIVMFVSSFKAPMFIERYVLFTSPFLYIFMAALISLLPLKKWIIIFLSIVFIMAMGFTYNNKPYNNRETAQAVDFVKSNKTEQTLVLVCPDYYYFAFTYHYDKAIFKEYTQTKQMLADEHIYLVSNQFEVIKILKESKYEQIIYFQSISEYVDAKNTIYNLLEKHFTVLDKKHFHEIYTVTVFG